MLLLRLCFFILFFPFSVSLNRRSEKVSNYISCALNIRSIQSITVKMVHCLPKSSLSHSEIYIVFFSFRWLTTIIIHHISSETSFHCSHLSLGIMGKNDVRRSHRHGNSKLLDLLPFYEN